MFHICYYFCEILLIYSFGKVPTREQNKKTRLFFGYFIYYSNTYAIASHFYDTMVLLYPYYLFE
jgi:hypothetical protein